MSGDLEKKQNELTSNAGYNMLAIFIGLLLVILTSGFFKVVGWFMLAAGGVGMVAAFFVGSELDKEAAAVAKAATMKQCPACAEDIKKEAKKCKHCGEQVA